jgi:hypothetical protein
MSATTAGSVTEIQWYGVVDDYVYSEVRYTDVNDVTQTVRVLASESLTSCPDVKTGSTYEYRSRYAPANSIDTFDMAWTPIIPVIKYDKSSWSVISWSDEQVDDGGGAAMIIDGNLNNWWHSAYKDITPQLPHWAIIDMAVPKEIARINTYRRPGNTNTKSVWYYIGDDPDPEAASWTKIAEGTFASGNLLALQTSVSVAGRYLKIYLPDSNSSQHTSVAEVDAFGYE